MINIDDFCKVEIVVGLIKEVEEIEESEKMLRLKIDVGEVALRNILSGIKKFYKKEDLIGKKCLVASNLEPRKMMGEESEGMLLGITYTKENEEFFNIVEPNENSPIGHKLS